jgi:hypothetical protein
MADSSRNYISDFLEARLPDFFSQLADCMERAVATNNEEHPDHHCIVRHRTISLIGVDEDCIPYAGVRVVMNVRAQTLDVLQHAELDSIGEPERPKRVPVRISVASENGREGSAQFLAFNFQAKRYRWPKELADAILKFVFAV